MICSLLGAISFSSIILNSSCHLILYYSNSKYCKKCMLLYNNQQEQSTTMMYKYSGVKNVFAYLSHLNDSDHQTNVYITQKFKFINFEITISFIKGKKAVQTCLALREKVIAPKSNNWLCHPLQQHLQSSIRDNGQ